MCPVFFHIGSIPVSGYWCMTVLGLAITYAYLALTNHFDKKRRIAFVHIHNLCCLAILAIYFGGAAMGFLVQLPRVIANWDSFGGDLGKILGFALEQRAFFGGVILMGLLIFWYCRRYGLPGGYIAELYTPAVPLFMIFGRLGCLMGGCCYGIPVSWGMVFPEGSAAPAGVALFPSQIAESAANLFLFVLLLLAKKRLRKQSHMVWLYAAGYSVIRFTLEFFRGDAARGGLWLFSTSQWISLVLLAASGYTLFVRGKIPKN